ncbi:hypothetical protein HKX48_007042 [Thoreauomyces humboldtii]|nr:hypothetical protein HKX48_007042 [Thoreauomyces humboldtii]
MSFKKESEDAPSYITQSQTSSENSRALSHLDAALDDPNTVAPPPGASKKEVGRDVADRIADEDGHRHGHGHGAGAAASHAKEAAGTDGKGMSQRREMETEAVADKGF